MCKRELYTVITGASRGLGRSLAIECAEKGRNLILVSLPNESVSQTAKELSKKYNVKAVYYETGLTRENNLVSLAAWIKSNY